MQVSIFHEVKTVLKTQRCGIDPPNQYKEEERMDKKEDTLKHSRVLFFPHMSGTIKALFLKNKPDWFQCVAVYEKIFLDINMVSIRTSFNTRIWKENACFIRN